MENCLLFAAVLMMCSLSESNLCFSKDIKYDTTCSTNCSQWTPRIPGDKVFFNCSVGAKKEVDRYRQFHGKDFLPESAIFDAPEMRGVELYWKHFETNTEIALKLNFSLPKGIIKNPVDWRLPKAVLLRFESIPGPYGDSYYMNCPREKIYQFKFNPVNSYDIYNPRQLMDDCFVGLDKGNDKSVYNITLQTAEGKNASYITTVTVRAVTPVMWHPVIMTYLNVTDSTLYTVVERPPASYEVHSFNVSLVLKGNIIRNSAIIKLQITNSTRFTNLTKGVYKIMVRPLCQRICSKPVNRVTESYTIDASILPGDPKTEDSPHYLEESLKPMKVIAMVMGCILGAILLLAIAYYIHKRPKCQKHSSGVQPRGVLLHPLKRESVAVNQLKQYLSQACDCTITDCLDINLPSPNQTTTERVEKCLKNSTFVLVLYTSNCFHSESKTFEEDFYSCFLKMVDFQRQKHNDIRIIPLEFPLNENSDLPLVIKQSLIQPVKFPGDLDRLCCIIHGFPAKTERIKRNRCSKNLPQWRDIWTELTQTEQAQNNRPAILRETVPLLQETNEAEKLSVPGDQSVYGKPRLQNHFEQIAQFNAETDSLIGSLERHKLRDKEHKQNKQNDRKSQVKETLKHHEKLENYTNGRSYQSNLHKFEAEVHYSGEHTKSFPLEKERPALCPEDQALSLPTNIPYQPYNLNTIQKRCDSKSHFPYPYDGQSEFIPLMQVNIENNGTEGDLSDDYATKHQHFTDTCHSPPLLHGNLHHSHFFMPTGALGHRIPFHPENPNQPNHLFEQSNMSSGGNGVCTRLHNGHTANSRSHHTHKMTHHGSPNHFCHDYNHYQPDDFISGSPSHMDALQMNHMLLQVTEQEDYPGQSSYLLYTNQDGLQHAVKHLNDTESVSALPQEQLIQNLIKEQKLPPAGMNFDALDPPKAKVSNTPLLDVNKKSEEPSTNDLMKGSSVKSLPDLSFSQSNVIDVYEQFSPPDNLHGDSPEPPLDLSKCWRSQLMDELMEINKSHT